MQTHTSNVAVNVEQNWRNCGADTGFCRAVRNLAPGADLVLQRSATTS